MNAGWMFLGLTILSYAGWGLLVKVAQLRGADNYLLAILSTIGTVIITLLVCVPAVDWQNVKQYSSTWLPGIMAGVLVGLGNVFIYRAIKTVPISIVYPVSALYVGVTALLAFLFLKESITWNQGAGLGLALGAVFLLSR